MSQPETQPDYQNENGKAPEVEMSQPETQPDYQEENEKVPEVEMSHPEIQPNQVPKVQDESQSMPQEHHILDELQGKFLRRAEQDALRRAPQEGEEDGRGRGRGRGRGKGRGKGKGKGKGKKGRGKGESKPKGRKRVRRALQPEFEESVGSDSWSVKAVAGSDAPQPAPKKAPKAKQTAKSKASPKNKSKETRAKAAAKAKGVPKEKAKAKAKSTPAPPADADSAGAPKKLRGKKAHGVEIEIPVFNYATIVPYWSRNACALKMPESGNPSNITQAGFLHQHLLSKYLRNIIDGYRLEHVKNKACMMFIWHFYVPFIFLRCAAIPFQS